MSEGQIVEALAQAHNVVVGAMERKLAAKNAEIAKLQATIDALTPDAEVGRAMMAVKPRAAIFCDYRNPCKPHRGIYWSIETENGKGLASENTLKAALKAAGLWIKIKEGTDE